MVLTGLFFVKSEGFHTSLLGSWGAQRLYPCRPAGLWPETFIFQRHPGWDCLTRLNRALKLTDYSLTFHWISSHSLLQALLFPLLFSILHSVSLPSPPFLSFPSTFPSSLKISYLLTIKKKKSRNTFTVKVEQFPRGLDDRLFSASCYYSWCTSRGKSWMELTIRLSESINQWQRNYIRSPIWTERAGMLVLQLTEWGSCNKQLAPVESFFLFWDALKSNEGPFLPSTPRSAAIARRWSTYFVRGSIDRAEQTRSLYKCM